MTTDRAITGGPEWDVFISHNRANKRWVRELWQLLVGLDLKVFFDAESIQPGENYVVAISKALDSSRRIVLVLSEAALESEWVEMEAIAGVIADPGASQGRIIPVLLEAVAFERLPAPLRPRQSIDLSDRATRDEGLRKLLAALGVHLEGRERLPSWPSDTLDVVDIDGVVGWGWDGDQLVRELMSMDAEVYQEKLELNDDTFRAWAPLFFDYPESWRLIVDAPGRIIAYWHCLPMLPGDFDDLMSGRVTYDRVTPAQVATLGISDRCDLYCAGICVRRRYRRPFVFKALFESLLDVIEALAGDDILFQRVGANAFSPEGESLCRGLGMVRTGEHPKQGVLYAQTMSELVRSRLVQRRPKLVAAYA